jgi:glutamine synthetase
MELSSSGLKDFLQIPYTELEERNLAVKDDRRKRKSQDAFRKDMRAVLEKERTIKAVTVCFTDIEGKMLMLDYNKAFLLESEDNLTFDGSSIRGFTAQNESDLRLKIDWSSFRWLPADIFGPGKVLVFANVHDKDGRPYMSDFRAQLQMFSEDLYDKDKMVVHVAPEIEGILLEGTDAEQNYNSREGFRLVTKGGYFHAMPQDPLRKFIDSVAEAQRALGFENEKDHPEVAPSQFELNYKYTDILQAADNVQIYKLICKQIAKTMGYTATFLPKPRMNINGSGMHTNMSLSQNGRNIFYDADGENRLSMTAHNFLTSILYHAKDICLVLNSSVNSYRRLDPHFEAPNEIKVSANDRGSMVRIPLGNEKSARIEVRSVAPDCNPYLTMYTLLRTGLRGINSTEAELREFETVLSKREKLPGNIYDALRYFKRSTFMAELLGAENHSKFASFKEASANRCPKDLGTRVKLGEVVYHHEITNQVLWNGF